MRKYRIQSSLVRIIMCQLFGAMEYFHSKMFLHRDLKPQNILFDPEKKLIKITDFGLSRKFAPWDQKRTYTNKVVTLWYRSPELLLGSETYGIEIDMWSLGCIFVEISNNTPLFPGHDEQNQLCRIFSILGFPDKLRHCFKENIQVPCIKNSLRNLDSNGQQLVLNLLDYNQQTRTVSYTHLRAHET